MSRSFSEILGEYIVYMMFVPFNGFMCLLAGDSDREWCTMAQEGFVGWSIVVLPIALISVVAWASRQGRPLRSLLGVICVVLGVGLVLYLLRGFLFGLLQAATQVVVIAFIIVGLMSFLLRMN